VFKVNARTVLELGSELISSDIIAFYELIKNAFDAGSKSGAEIHFNIVFRRNDYLRLKARAIQANDAGGSKTERLNRLNDIKSSAIRVLDPAAGSDRVTACSTTINAAESLEDLVARLDACYSTANTIEISDVGSGMSLAEITKNFLTLGTPARKREVDRAMAAGEKKSPFLGEKGIGRLSVMRLGDRLRLETARAEDTYLNLLDVDWRQFEGIDTMLEDISIEPKRGPKKEPAAYHGTRLKISGLLEDWTEKRVREFAEKDFARLTDPFVDPKSRPRVAIFWNSSRVAIPWLDRILIENAHAILTGTYTVKGDSPRLELQMTATKLGKFEHPVEKDTVVLTRPELEALIEGSSNDVPQSALTSVGNFSFEIYWYNRRYLTKIESLGNQTIVRALVKKWSSILLFRDGFRVFPYGDQEDDWLGLDAVALGRTGYILNKNQFIGHVKISRTENPGLVDQTNREGLRATPEFQVFVGVLHNAVAYLLWNFFKEIDGRYNVKAADLDVKKEVSQLETRAKVALSRLRKFVPKDEISVFSDLEFALREFHDLSERAQLRIDEVEEEGRQMVQMAGVGLLVEMIAHELARATESALQSLEGLSGKDVPAEIRAKIETLRAEMKSVSKRLRVLDEASVSGRQRSELFDLGDLVEDLKEGHKAQFGRHGIEMKIVRPKGAIRVKLVKGMVVQILENLLSNSVYWMNLRADREADYKPVVTVKITTDPLAIHFSDNGRGIAPDHRERVFRPFWSLKEKQKRRGLGLYIASENAKHLKGSLSLSDKPDRVTERLHEFVLELPDGALHK
jgi:signal transduction histidine kinase